jgi:DNA-directed RNA polymerase specialized sigma subunit
MTEQQEIDFMIAWNERACLTLLENILEGASCINHACRHHIYNGVSIRQQHNMKDPDASLIYGCMLAVHKEHTLEEIGQSFGMSRERIRQIEERALNKLKKRRNRIEMEME